MKGLAKIVLGGMVLAAVALGYRAVTKKPNDDHRNYDVVFQKLTGWKELPHNPNTLLLMRHPESNTLLRCSATQIVSDYNPEPDMDTKNLAKQVIENATQNQPNWKTERLDRFDNGKVQFELFKKTNKEKTILAALAVRGNTTLLVSMSGTGAGASLLSDGKFPPLFEFLESIDLQVTNKWVEMHEKLEETASLN